MSTTKKIALMAVGDDGWQGGIQYISNIMNALNMVSPEQPVEVHLFRHSAQNFKDISRLKNIKVVEHNTEEVYEPWTTSNRFRWLMQRKMSGRINPRIENYMLKQNFDYVFPATLSDCGGKLNVGSWIADFQYHHFPNGARKDVVKEAERIITNIATRSKKIILSSKFCEKDCLQLFPVTKGFTHVMPFAVAIHPSELEFRDFASIRAEYNLPEQFFMVANLFAPTKNHKTVFDAMGILRKKGIRVNLVCTGNIVDYRNEGFANEILQMLTKNQIREQVYLLGLVPRAHQLAMFRMSVAMMQPSVNEGWSTSVEEAKVLGKDLVLSDIEVHLEQNPGNPYFFKSLDAEDLAKKMEQIWTAVQGKQFPETEKEAAAFNKYQENVKEFGKRFLEIANC